MHLVTMLLLGASPFSLAAPITNQPHPEAANLGVEIINSKRQLQSLGALSELLGPFASLMGALSGGLKKREDGEYFPIDGLKTREPLGINEVTGLLSSIESLLAGGTGNLGGVLKREGNSILAKDEASQQPATHDITGRADNINNILTGLLITLAPMVGFITDPVSGLFGGKGWNRLVKKGGELQALVPLTNPLESTVEGAQPLSSLDHVPVTPTDSVSSLGKSLPNALAVVAGTVTDPVSPLIGGKGYSKRDINGLEEETSSLAGKAAVLFGEATDPISPLVGGKGYKRGINGLEEAPSRLAEEAAVLFGEATDPISPLVGGKGYKRGTNDLGNVLAVAAGEVTDPVSPLAGGKGSESGLTKRNINELGKILAVVAGEVTDPVSPLVGGKGFGSDLPKRAGGQLAGLENLTPTLAGSLATLGQALGPNQLAVIFGQVTDPFAFLVDGKGYNK